jgi:acyl carrier protein
MNGRSREMLLADLAGILRNFHGREYSGPIDWQTRFFGELGLASIDAVLLGETLERRYGQKFPFSELLADLGRRQAEDLELGELVDFLHLYLSKSEKHRGGEG